MRTVLEAFQTNSPRSTHGNIVITVVRDDNQCMTYMFKDSEVDWTIIDVKRKELEGLLKRK